MSPLSDSTQAAALNCRAAQEARPEKCGFRETFVQCANREINLLRILSSPPRLDQKEAFVDHL